MKVWQTVIMCLTIGGMVSTFVTAAGVEQSAPHKPFVYRYQWPGEFGDQRMTICISKGHGFDCRASRTSDEL